MSGSFLRGKWGWIGQVLGVVLILGAALVAVGSIDWQVLRGIRGIRGDDLRLVALLAAAVVGNLVVGAMLFWSITLSFDARPTVRPVKMLWLIAVSSLLNYLPMFRAGMLGRAAYLKWRHKLPLSQSLVILMVVLGLAVVVLGGAAAVIVLFRGERTLWAGMVVMVVVTALTGPTARRLLGRRVIWPGLWIPLRCLDMLLAGGRLYLAFALMGEPISFAQAVLLGAAALAVKLTGLTPNGLGLSEWAVGGLAAVMSPSLTTATAVGAALIDRAVEIVVVTLAAGVGAWQLRTKASRSRKRGN